MFNPDLLKNKRILITGGGTGLGKGMAERFLELGATVYICGRREEILKHTAAELSAKGVIEARVCDVRNLDAVEAMIDSIWNAGPLDVLVNNAAGNFIARTEELSARAFESVVGIVLMGTLHCTMACGRRWLKAAHSGTVLSISATYAPVGSAYVVPSAVSKAGVEALTRSLAVEWGNRGIRMNAIAPGPIPTQGAFSRVLPRPDLETLALDRNPLPTFRNSPRTRQPRGISRERRIGLTSMARSSAWTAANFCKAPVNSATWDASSQNKIGRQSSQKNARLHSSGWMKGLNQGEPTTNYQ